MTFYFLISVHLFCSFFLKKNLYEKQMPFTKLRHILFAIGKQRSLCKSNYYTRIVFSLISQLVAKINPIVFKKNWFCNRKTSVYSANSEVILKDIL
jgi:hypothetical protein